MPPNFAKYYDAVINWQKRLERELPMLEDVARRAGSRVLVPACGTGGHVVALAQRGFRVLGCDVEESAVEFTRRRIDSSARAIAAAGGEARVLLLNMAEADQLGPVHDAAFCLGNALPGLSQPGQLPVALRGVAATLHPGGLFLTQNLNYDRRWREKAKFFPLLAGETQEEEVLLVKFADYEAEFINFHAMFLTREKPAGEWQAHARSSRQFPLLRSRLADLLGEAGFGNLCFWGDFTMSPFEPEKSHDLIVAATKR